MNDYEIRIDKDGLWYYNGNHMYRKDILHVFFQNLKIDECGNYLIELGEERCYLEVEDTPFVVMAVYKIENTQNHEEKIEILLSDDSCETLDINSLMVGDKNVLYCRVKDNKFKARFSRKGYYQLAEFIEQSGTQDVFFITLNKKNHYIKSVTIS